MVLRPALYHSANWQGATSDNESSIAASSQSTMAGTEPLCHRIFSGQKSRCSSLSMLVQVVPPNFFKRVVPGGRSLEGRRRVLTPGTTLRFMRIACQHREMPVSPYFFLKRGCQGGSKATTAAIAARIRGINFVQEHGSHQVWAPRKAKGVWLDFSTNTENGRLHR